jgi:hypothetical protein
LSINFLASNEAAAAERRPGMNYCENCMLLTGEDVCPRCRRKKLRPPKDDDFCFLADKEMIWGGMLADVLKQKGIPYYERSVLGAGLATETGFALERYRYYVPFSQLSEAREIVEELFGEEGKE